MSKDREAMNAALAETVVPVLREKGFKGSLPHFRRVANGAIELLTFQFDKWGGGFIIEIARCAECGFTTTWGEHIPANKVTAWDLAPMNHRIQPQEGSGTDSWFRYDTGWVPLLSHRVKKAAQQVLLCLPQAELWWQYESQQGAAPDHFAAASQRKNGR